MTIRYVDIDDPFMAMLYSEAKQLYRISGWNEKAAPVCVIVRDGIILGRGASGHGNHQVNGYCDRQNKPKSDYSACKWCVEELHAEAIALRAMKRERTSARGASVYMYGHWHACKACTAAMEKAGVKELVLLEGSHILFDRHNSKSVIGKPQQFAT